MNLNKLTEKAQDAIVAAQHLAEERHHTQIEPEHLLAALLDQQGGVVPAVLERLGVPSRHAPAGVRADRQKCGPLWLRRNWGYLGLLPSPRRVPGAGQLPRHGRRPPLSLPDKQ